MNLYNLNGWLDRNGKFYECSKNGHKQKAVDLKSDEYHLEMQGWVKIYDGVFLMSEKCPFRPTSNQNNVIWNFCMKYENNNQWDQFYKDYVIK